MRPATHRPHSKSAKVRFHPVVLAGIVVLLLAAFSLGYHCGTDTGYRPKLKENRRLFKQVTSHVGECNANLSRIAERSSDPEVGEIRSSREKVDYVTHGVQREYEDVFNEYDACADELSDLQNKYDEASEEQTSQRALISLAEGEIEKLRSEVRLGTAGEGMSVLPFMRYIAARRKEYVEHCSTEPGCMVLNNTELFLEFQDRVNDTEAQVLAEEDERRLMKSLPQPLVIDKDKSNAKDIVFHTDSVADIHSAVDPGPFYFNRSTVQERNNNKNTTLPTSLGKQAIRVANAYAYLRHVLLPSAFCAYKTNQSDVTIPSTFIIKIRKDKHVESFVVSAAELFETPLLRFAEEEEQVAEVGEDGARKKKKNPLDALLLRPHHPVRDMDGRFMQLLPSVYERCSVELFRKAYGGRAFWAVRSLVRPVHAIRADAWRFIDSRMLTDRKVLAVIVDERSNMGLFCPPNHHFVYLKSAFSTDVNASRHLMKEPYKYCNPTAQDVLDAIKSVLSADMGIAAIYLSVPEELRDDIVSISQQKKDGIADRFVSYDPSSAATTTDRRAKARHSLVDLEIAARSHAILVSASQKSRYVTEAFLLRNDIDPKGRVWFF